MNPVPHLPFNADFWSLRISEEVSEVYRVRKDAAQQLARSSYRAAMATVHHRRG